MHLPDIVFVVKKSYADRMFALPVKGFIGQDVRAPSERLLLTECSRSQ